MNNIKQAIFGGGCFWCTEAIFQDLEGVEAVTSGFSGGDIKNPAYREVCTGRTNHAEVVKIEYDPSVISYEDLVVIHMTTHNPTTLNRQGGDVGTQYRSAIFYSSDSEKKIAEAVIKELQPHFEDKIVTELTSLEAFYPAEEEHQNYYKRNTEAAFCQAVINPKLKKFREVYRDKLKTNH